MTITIKGFTGTVTDTEMATQLGLHDSGSVMSATDLAVSQTNVGARQIRIEPGVANQAFIKYTSDAPQFINLDPPTSGGCFYLVALQRQWAPTSSCVLEATKLGSGAATDGTLPLVGIAPYVYAAALAQFRNHPGTSGDYPNGAHQPLALVHVRAADSAITIWDLRMLRTGTQNLTAASIHALIFANQVGLLAASALIALAAYPMVPAYGYHTRSLWVRSGDAVPGGLWPASNICVGEAYGGGAREFLAALAGANLIALGVGESVLYDATLQKGYNWDGSHWF